MGALLMEKKGGVCPSGDSAPYAIFRRAYQLAPACPMPGQVVLATFNVFSLEITPTGSLQLTLQLVQPDSNLSSPGKYPSFSRRLPCFRH